MSEIGKLKFMRGWLARLSYSFVIIALWLIWEAYVSVHRRGVSASSPVVITYILGAAMSLSLGVQGIRERHRRG